MKKRLLSLTMAGVMTLGVASAFTACSGTGGEQIVDDGKTINVKVMQAGYGSTFVYAIKEKFEAAYANEGYKMNILTPQRDISGTNVMREIYSDGGVDVYFTGISPLEQGLYGEYGVCYADITESVFNQKPIKFDGTEEEQTVAEKLDLDKVYYDIKDGDKYYGLPWNSGMRGLAVNTVVMEEYGLELPRTSDEMFECFEVIMEQAANTGVFPITHIPGKNNYASSFLNLWMAQYGGAEEFERFWSMENADGTPMENGYEVFESESIRVMLKNMYRVYDYNVATFGSTTQDLTTGQSQLMRGNCAFMMNGDWLLNEVSSAFSKKLNDITFINVPVVSDLAVKLFSSYNDDRSWCDEVMSEIIGYVDQNKSVAEIKTAIDAKYGKDFKTEEIQTVAEARGYYLSEATWNVAVISENSEMKDIAALLLRMCASEDGANLIAETTNAGNPFTKTANLNAQYAWVKSASAISQNVYSHSLRPDARGYRYTLTEYSSIFPYTGIYVPTRIEADAVTIYNNTTLVKEGNISSYETAANALYELIKKDAKNRW